MKDRPFSARSAAAAVAMAALTCAASPSTVWAQRVAHELSRAAQVSGKVTVKSVDPATRHLTVVEANGDTHTLKVASDIKNLDKVKPGDKISVTYTVSAAFVISPRGAPLPKDTEHTVASRAAKGEIPSAAVANHIIVTGAVIGIDTAHNTLRLVSPQGGLVHTLEVESEEGRRELAQLKVGDKITAYITESMLVALHPA
ncbi:hypothetical protein [Phenylobacterium sp.]|jgi:hypothetical protein|uniref:hypothetical protein n=1 Tax=Phenylobacterium sp. TaxID=1871053 RepID=UPI002F4081AC